ncbi:hypothetical protein GCM10028803_30150 [Larkinella knui]|uniref:Uncharacterized protein n=1 Tax=Larkinella knui TaxID=2025310 RepID=A0A3P1CXN2_9BACT|nr:hypothetical protein [Larkinella knui]RRB18043.1 hypothetical protein EHT87_07155 [Larkinella knui]
MKTQPIQFISPIDGDMLHARDGESTPEGVLIDVRVAAPSAHRLTINGQDAVDENGIFSAKINLTQDKTTIAVHDQTSGETSAITVFRLPHFAGKYRLSIDDNIWFLRDIGQQPAAYPSLFDHPYLGFLKHVHETYGTKIHLNLFYQTDGFTLSEFPDRYKPEWQANANWLRLSFHARSEFPDKPYEAAGYEQVSRDCAVVDAEIRRFAGQEVMGPVTTIHWGEATVEGSRALRDAGYAGQLGYFNVDDDLPTASYYLTVEQRRHLKKRFVWHDTQEGISFVRASIVIDKKELPDIVPFLDAYAESPSGKPPFVDLLVHEQYFYPFYEAYQPDYRNRILTAVKWATDNGYTPAFLGDALFTH